MDYLHTNPIHPEKNSKNCLKNCKLHFIVWRNCKIQMKSILVWFWISPKKNISKFKHFTDFKNIKYMFFLAITLVLVTCAILAFLLTIVLMPLWPEPTHTLPEIYVSVSFYNFKPWQYFITYIFVSFIYNREVKVTLGPKDILDYN